MMSLCVGLWQWRSDVALLILIAFTIAYLYEYKNQEVSASGRRRDRCLSASANPCLLHPWRPYVPRGIVHEI